MGAISLSVIIPAFNEENRIVGTVSEIDQYMKSRGCGYEIIVVDDGSTDATVPVVLSMKGKVSNLQILRNGVNRGKGFSVKNGFLHASGEILLFTDADLSTPIDEFGKLLEYILRGYDIAIGSRGLPDSDIVVHQVRVIRDSAWMLANLVNVRINDLRGYYT